MFERCPNCNGEWLDENSYGYFILKCSLKCGMTKTRFCLSRKNIVCKRVVSKYTIYWLDDGTTEILGVKPKIRTKTHLSFNITEDRINKLMVLI